VAPSRCISPASTSRRQGAHSNLSKQDLHAAAAHHPKEVFDIVLPADDQTAKMDKLDRILRVLAEELDGTNPGRCKVKARSDCFHVTGPFCLVGWRKLFSGSATVARV
jgi:hypothetical protein